MALTMQLRNKSSANTLTCRLSLTYHQHRRFSDDANNSKSPFSSYFTDIKHQLKKPQPTTTPPARNSFTPSNSNSSSSKLQSLQEIRTNLSEFRRRTSPPPSADPSSGPISFQEIYNRNISENSGRSAGTWDSIRAKMQQLSLSPENKQGGDPMPLSAFRNTLRSNHSDPSSATTSSVFGGTGGLPSAIFGNELREKKSSSSSSVAATGFSKMYSHAELGAKLRKLRPEVGGKEWFSLGELNERLTRLREMEEKESLSTIKGTTYRDLKESLRIQLAEEDRAKKTSLQRIDILAHFGRIPEDLHPPKEQLVERYFHPDNMSSAEKLKIELAKIRGEFKMSESDCGSAPVQVAQLTTKIKHLSSVLHKKDKHSRKGLIAMVQRRKRLLKYLRSTDWDSYCFVISKLGLRDNPDIKA